MIDSVAGAMTFAIPTPSRTATPMMNQTLVVGVNVTNINSDVATINSPAPTTTFVPARSTSRAETGARIIIAAAWGMRIAPASSGSKPCTDCRYWVSRKMVPNNAMNVRVMAPDAALKRGFLKNRTLSIGYLHVVSHQRNALNNTAERANAPSTDADPQPAVGPSMTAQSRLPRPTIDSSAPSGSRGGDAGSL